MRVLFIGDLNAHTRTAQRLRVFKDLGHEVRSLSFSPDNYLPGISGQPSILNRGMYKLGYPLDDTGVNHAILQEVSSNTFNFVWIEKGLMIRPSVIRKIKKLHPGVKIASYTEDDMFARHNQSAYYRASLSLFDVVFTTKSYNCDLGELPSLGAKKVVFVDKSFDRYTHRPVPVSDGDREAYGADVGFIGTFEEDRAEKMFFLAKSGIEVRVWGNGWKRWVGKHSILRIENQPIYGAEYVKSLCSTKINLCFLRKSNRDLQTDRTMEIPACEAFMLAERTEEHERLFKDGKEAAYFNTSEPDELLEKVRYYLDHEQERQQIARCGRERCLNSGYSHHDRIQWMMSHIWIHGFP